MSQGPKSRYSLFLKKKKRALDSISYSWDVQGSVLSECLPSTRKQEKLQDFLCESNSTRGPLTKLIGILEVQIFHIIGPILSRLNTSISGNVGPLWCRLVLSGPHPMGFFTKTNKSSKSISNSIVLLPCFVTRC